MTFTELFFLLGMLTFPMVVLYESLSQKNNTGWILLPGIIATASIAILSITNPGKVADSYSFLPFAPTYLFAWLIYLSLKKSKLPANEWVQTHGKTGGIILSIFVLSLVYASMNRYELFTYKCGYIEETRRLDRWTGSTTKLPIR